MGSTFRLKATVVPASRHASSGPLRVIHRARSLPRSRR